ncbi:hypothetical protein AB1Y20_015487 [Prymnesium parvum]|uniref:Nuclear protein MDM1 n=1 Tax=Prymnesium parvum TaxID=97485 RepID=A0AB34JXW3_PRYPA
MAEDPSPRRPWWLPPAFRDERSTAGVPPAETRDTEAFLHRQLETPSAWRRAMEQRIAEQQASAASSRKTRTGGKPRHTAHPKDPASTSSGTPRYEVLWRHDRERRDRWLNRSAAEAAEKERRELEHCTFTPQLRVRSPTQGPARKPPSSSSPDAAHHGDGGEAAPTAVQSGDSGASRTVQPQKTDAFERLAADGRRKAQVKSRQWQEARPTSWERESVTSSPPLPPKETSAQREKGAAEALNRLAAEAQEFAARSFEALKHDRDRRRRFASPTDERAYQTPPPPPSPSVLALLPQPLHLKFDEAGSAHGPPSPSSPTSRLQLGSVEGSFSKPAASRGCRHCVSSAPCELSAQASPLTKSRDDTLCCSEPSASFLSRQQQLDEQSPPSAGKMSSPVSPRLLKHTKSSASKLVQQSAPDLSPEHEDSRRLEKKTSPAGTVSPSPPRVGIRQRLSEGGASGYSSASEASQGSCWTDDGVGEHGVQVAPLPSKRSSVARHKQDGHESAASD